MKTDSKSWWSKDTVAVVTGSNTGIGYEIARQLAEQGLTVVITSLDPVDGQPAVDKLKAHGLESVFCHPLDMCSSESINSLAAWLKKQFGGIDILVNNAGTIHTSYGYENAKRIIDTNYRGTKNVTEALLPLLRASPAGARIITATSRAGMYERLASESLKQKFRNEDNYHSAEMVDSMAAKYLADMKAGRAVEEGWIPATSVNLSSMYSESKIFLGAYLIFLAKSLAKSQPEGHQILVASFCPGGTMTDMFAASLKGGLQLPDGFPIKTPAEGADTGVWLALLPKHELAPKVGRFFEDRSEFSFGGDTIAVLKK